MEKVVYIHYGSKAFDSANGFPIHNRKDWNKPQGGLWASRETASFGWKDWCEQEHFRECDPLNSFRFMLRDDARVCTIHSMAELKQLPFQKESSGFWLWSVLPDFEECLRQGYDAIELCWYGNEYQDLAKDNMYDALYGWDCDSIVVLNPDAVIPC